MEIALIQKIQVTIPDQDNHNPPQDVYQNFFKKLFSLKLHNSGTGGPVVKTPCFHCREYLVTRKIPHATQYDQKN